MIFQADHPTNARTTRVRRPLDALLCSIAIAITPVSLWSQRLPPPTAAEQPASIGACDGPLLLILVDARSEPLKRLDPAAWVSPKGDLRLSSSTTNPETECPEALVHFLDFERLGETAAADVGQVIQRFVPRRGATSNSGRPLDVAAVGWAGLALRTFVQSAAYVQGSLRSVAFVGTPHRGLPPTELLLFGSSGSCDDDIDNARLRTDLRDLGRRVRADSAIIQELNLGSGRHRSWPTSVPIRNLAVAYENLEAALCKNVRSYRDKGRLAVRADAADALSQSQRFPTGALDAPNRRAIFDTVLVADKTPLRLDEYFLGDVAVAVRQWAGIVRPATTIASGVSTGIRDSVLIGGTGAEPPLVLRSLCPIGQPPCADPNPHRMFRRTLDPDDVIELPPLLELRTLSVPNVILESQPNADTANRLAPTTLNARVTESSVVIAAVSDDSTRTFIRREADRSTAIVPLQRRPGVFRYREVLEERRDLCIQGRGDARQLSITSHCYLNHLVNFPPLDRWEEVEGSTNVTVSKGPADGLDRGIGFTSAVDQRFDLRLLSPDGRHRLESLDRVEIEIVGTVPEDSVRTRFGFVDSLNVLHWSEFAVPAASREPAAQRRDYARFEVNIERWLQTGDLDRELLGRGALVLQVRGRLARRAGASIRVIVTPVGRQERRP